MIELTRSSLMDALELSVRSATLSVLVEGFRRRSPNAVVNALVMFWATHLPNAAEQRFEVEFRAWQRVYAGVAMFAHAVGFLGPYDDTWWWDHLTHVLSASLLGGGIHVVARCTGRDPKRAVLAGVVGGGVLWEAVEYAIHALSNRLGVEALLVHYGPRDTLFDLLFNLVGASLVLLFGDRLLGNVVDQLPGDSSEP